MTLGEQVLGRGSRRSDMVRARRAQTRKKIERAGIDIAPKPPRKRRAKRRYDVSISEEMSTELQLPAVPTVRIGSRLLAIGLLALSIWGLQMLVDAEVFQVLQVSLSGNELLKASQIRSLANLEGQSIFLIDPRAVEFRLEEEPEVERASVQVRWPNEVGIQIEERDPVVEWDDGGRIWWLSSDGIAYVEQGDHSNLVRVQAEEPVLSIGTDANSPVIDPEVLSAAAVLTEQLSIPGELIFDRDHGLGFEDSGGWMAYFGTDGDMSMKADIYLAIVDRLDAENIQATLVSVEDHSAPFYQAENQFTWQP